VAKNTKEECTQPSNESKKEKQWLEIQARVRKTTVSDFQVLVLAKRSDFLRTIETLKSSSPSTLSAVASALDSLDGADQYFRGGTKEMRECVPAFQAIERKIDIMTEYVNITRSMTEADDETHVRLVFPVWFPVAWMELRMCMHAERWTRFCAVCRRWVLLAPLLQCCGRCRALWLGTDFLVLCMFPRRPQSQRSGRRRGQGVANRTQASFRVGTGTERGTDNQWHPLQDCV